MVIWENIRSDYESGMSYSEMAQKHNEKINTIKSRKQREKWTRIENIQEKDNNTTEVLGILFGQGFDISTMVKKMDEEDNYEELMLKSVKCALFALGTGQLSKVQAKYNGNGVLVSRIVTGIPPSPNALSHLEWLDERIGLLAINMNEYETEEEREERYLAYRRDVEVEREYYENRDIEKALEELGKIQE